MIKLSIIDTVLSSVPLVLAAILYYRYLDRGLDFIRACARMVLQLLTIGYFLTFLFAYDLPWIGLLVLLFMTAVASSIVLRPLTSWRKSHYLHVFIALFFSGCLHLFWIVFVVLKLTPWYQPEIVIPLAGMLFANSMNSLSLGLERLESDTSTQNPIRAAFNAAMIPQINTLLAVGLVSLPGMMTGQILSGVSPLEAVRYQIMIMSAIVGGSAVSLAIYFALHRNLLSNQREQVQNSAPEDGNEPT